jgi:hypothetical protein
MFLSTGSFLTWVDSHSLIGGLTSTCVQLGGAALAYARIQRFPSFLSPLLLSRILIFADGSRRRRCLRLRLAMGPMSCVSHFQVLIFLTFRVIHPTLLLYSGGRDLSGNKRTNKEQSKEQTFEKFNLALKVSCREGYPVRVVR